MKRLRNPVTLRIEPDSTPHLAPAPESPAVRRSPWRRGLVVVGILLFLALAPFVIRWASYRTAHIVTHDAFVNGIVANLGARIDGQVKSIDVEVNRPVRQGDILLRLEDTHLQAKVEAARAELQRTTQELDVERLSIRQDHRLLNAGVERAALEQKIAAAELDETHSQLERWKRELERHTKLHAEGLEPTSMLEEAAARHDVALATQQAAHARREKAESGRRYTQIELESLAIRESRLRVRESDVEKARAALAVATAEAEAAIIRAPGDGWVVEAHVGPGASVRVGQPMLSFWGRDQVWVEAWIDQKDLAKIAVGNPADIALNAYSGSRLEGHVEAVWAGVEGELKRHEQNAKTSPLLARDSKIRVRIALPPVDAPLLPGLSAVVGIRRGLRKPAQVASTDPAKP